MGMFEWVDPTREALQKYLRGRTDTVSSVLGAAADMVRDPQARRSALERAPKPFQMTDADMDAAMSFWNPGGLMAKIVYHGSPHKFDKFDASKIGTGEGAQAYGHGVYLADAEDVAKGYQKTLAYKAFDLGQEAEKRGLKLSAGARGEFHRQAAANRDPMRAAVGLQNANISARELPQEKLAELFDAFQKDGTGALYKADLPDEWIPKMLDWDKPLAEQAPEVRAALQKLGELMPDSKLRKGSGAMGLAESRLGSKAAAAQALREAGIPGIRYLDGGSRGAGQGSYNYVVFPGLEDRVKILERNGIPLEGMFKMDKK